MEGHRLRLRQNARLYGQDAALSPLPYLSLHSPPYELSVTTHHFAVAMELQKRDCGQGLKLRM